MSYGYIYIISLYHYVYFQRFNVCTRVNYKDTTAKMILLKPQNNVFFILYNFLYKIKNTLF